MKVLSTLDEQRAERVDEITAKDAEILMNRLDLMSQVRDFTKDAENIRVKIKPLGLDEMPEGGQVG